MARSTATHRPSRISIKLLDGAESGWRAKTAEMEATGQLSPRLNHSRWFNVVSAVGASSDTGKCRSGNCFDPSLRPIDRLARAIVTYITRALEEHAMSKSGLILGPSTMTISPITVALFIIVFSRDPTLWDRK